MPVWRAIVAAAGATLVVAAASASPAVAGLGRHGPAEPVQLPTGFRPEGIASGPGDRYYVGSLADGRILTGDLSRGTREVLLPGQTGRALRGMQWDRRSNLLWVAGNDGATGIVLAVDAWNGTVRARVEVPGSAFLNDLVITRRAVWVTDSRVDRLTRLPVDRHGELAGEPSFLPLTGAWPVPTPTSIRANGIRALPDGTLVLNHSSAGGLWQVHPRSGVVRALPVVGGPGITGGDGLELVRRTLYVVRGSGQQEVSVLWLRRDRSGWTAHWLGRLTSPDLDVPSTATFARGRLWAVNARFGVPNPSTAEYAIVPLPPYPR